MPPKLKNLKLEIRKNIAYITLNRPKHLNVFDTETLNELEKTLISLENNAKVKVVCLLSDHDKVFTAGANIKEMNANNVIEAKHFAELGHRIAQKLETMPQPVIVGINGYALGGGVEFACACDIRIASERAVLSQPEIDIGIIPGWGGTQRLARIVGPGKAKELIYTGKRINAEEAFEIGLVNMVVPADKLNEAVKEMAETIASKGKIALFEAKKAINQVSQSPLDVGLRFEIESWSTLFETYDQKEGMGAFLEGRKPIFKDK
ncbi:MAG: enoyl-CoA hydratase/isomerase family protein [Thermoplasmata archaeon]|nr:MAG: enoyl-CoA hydratase/isomerase family protein [Thermoplasmata archaeon]